MVNVLITTAGSVSGVNCINALRNQSELKVKIIASDASEYAPGLYLADAFYLVPPFSEEERYVDELLAISQKESITVLLPTFSKELPIIAKNIDKFIGINVNICISPFESIVLFGNKWLSYLFFKENGIETPETWLLNTLTEFNSPLYIKPIIGSGSRKNCIVSDFEELYAHSRNNDPNEYVAQQIINAKEFTVDVMADRESKVIGMVPRERIKTKDGLAIVSRTIEEPGIIDNIEKIVSTGKLTGPINIQYFKTQEKRFLFFDVNTRFAAGGLPLSIRAGMNSPLISTKLALGMAVEKNFVYKKNLTMIRYFTELFFESLGQTC